MTDTAPSDPPQQIINHALEKAAEDPAKVYEAVQQAVDNLSKVLATENAQQFVYNNGTAQEFYGADLQQPSFLLFMMTFFISFISPMCFVLLQKFGPSIFRITTLSLMWGFGICYALYFKAKLFIVCWIIYTVLNLNMYLRTRRKELQASTPRVIYKYFLFTFRLNYYFSLGSAIVFLIYSAFFVSEEELRSEKFENQDMILYVFICALYFGILNRDFAEICAETIAIRSGFFGPDAIARNEFKPTICGICSEPMLMANVGTMSFEKYVGLKCGHSFHDLCIKGWCLVGKKNTCPYCHEKVDMNNAFQRPWEKVDLAYGGFLDVFRYFTGWMPLIIFLWKANIKLFHLK